VSIINSHQGNNKPVTFCPSAHKAENTLIQGPTCIKQYITVDLTLLETTTSVTRRKQPPIQVIAFQ